MNSVPFGAPSPVSLITGTGEPEQAGDGFECLVMYGARLIPLAGKRPVRKGWTSASPVSAKTARSWLQEGRNVGMLTGKESGLVVVDLDPRNGSVASMGDLEARLGPMPDTLTCVTGGGGEHRYFRYYPGARSSKPAAGVDFQANGSCVVLPPSVHPQTGAIYAWRDLPDCHHIAELPAIWREAMAGRVATLAEATPPEVVSVEEASIPQGSRNQSLFGLARALYGEGASESRVLARLSEINHLSCNPPLPPAEIRQIAQSAYRYKPTEQSHLTRWTQCLLRSDIGRRERLVGLALSSFADKDGGQCFPSQERIGERACYARPRVAEALNILMEAGWLERYSIPRHGHGWSYGYRLLIPDVTPENILG